MKCQFHKKFQLIFSYAKASSEGKLTFSKINLTKWDVLFEILSDKWKFPNLMFADKVWIKNVQ